jgi:hypothetical protein
MDGEYDPGRVARTRHLWEVASMRGPMIVPGVLLGSLMCMHASVGAQDGKKGEPGGADSATAAQQAARDVLAKFKKPQRTWKTEMECKVALAKADPATVPVLLDELKNGSPDSRAFAADALGFLGDVSARPGLAQAIDDKEHLVRARAIRSLGRLGRLESTPKYRQIADKDTSWGIRDEMTFALTRDDKPNPGAIRESLSSYDLKRMDTAHLDKPAPDFNLVDTMGKTWQLRDLRDKKPVVLVFLIGTG